MRKGGDQAQVRTSPMMGRTFTISPISLDDDDHCLNKTICRPWLGPNKMVRELPGLFLSASYGHTVGQRAGIMGHGSPGFPQREPPHPTRLSPAYPSLI